MTTVHVGEAIPLRDAGTINRAASWLAMNAARAISCHHLLQDARSTHRWHTMTRDDLRSDPDVRQARDTLRERLRLPVLDDAIAVLHGHVSRNGGLPPLRDAEGEPLPGLFNRFRIENNPMWRGKKQAD